jgi:cardiolipin synthase
LRRFGLVGVLRLSPGSFVDWIASYLTHHNLMLLLSVVWTAYVVVVGVWILLQRRAPVATLSWLLSMAVIPVVGIGVYYFLGPRRLKRQRLRRCAAGASRVRAAALPACARKCPRRRTVCSRWSSWSRRPPISRSARPTRWSCWWAERPRSTHHGRGARGPPPCAPGVHYIFEPDKTGLALLALLGKPGLASRCGCSWMRWAQELGRQHYQPLEEAGAEFALFHPTKLGRACAGDQLPHPPQDRGHRRLHRLHRRR